MDGVERAHGGAPPALPGSPRGLTERGVLRLGLGLSAAFVAAAILAFALPATGIGHWAGTHLALAGAALVAIGTVMPHFGATLAGSPSEPPALRLGGIGALAGGAVLAVGGIGLAVPAATVSGAVLVWSGLLITAWTTLRPARRPLARRHPIAHLAYGVALSEVAIGIALPVLLVIGWEPVVTQWARLKPAHVWLNLFGFVSLTISATLVYLYPTVLGARILAVPSLAPMLAGALAGPPLVAIGAALGNPALATAGAALALIGAAGQLAYGIGVWRRRGRWTTDPAWHRLSSGHLSAAMAWYLLAVAVATLGVMRDGPAPAGWRLGALAIPLLSGWTLQALVGSWSHLAPAVAVAAPERRAAVRATLGRAATFRLLAWNGGVLGAWIGLGLGWLPLAVAGIGTFTLAALLSVGLLLLGLRRG